MGVPWAPRVPLEGREGPLESRQRLVIRPAQVQMEHMREDQHIKALHERRLTRGGQERREGHQVSHAQARG